MEVNHKDVILNIAIAFSNALYLLNFEINSFGIGITSYLFEIGLDTIPMGI